MIIRTKYTGRQNDFNVYAHAGGGFDAYANFDEGICPTLMVTTAMDHRVI